MEAGFISYGEPVRPAEPLAGPSVGKVRLEWMDVIPVAIWRCLTMLPYRGGREIIKKEMLPERLVTTMLLTRLGTTLPGAFRSPLDLRFG